MKLSTGKYTHYRMVNLVPGELDYILCVHAPETDDVQLSNVHDNVTCPNCMDENVQSAANFYNSLVRAN